MPQVREDFKLHNRVGDAMRRYQKKHPFRVKAGAVVGGGVVALGTYIGASQIDRAIQKAQGKAEDKETEKQANLTATLEKDLLREKLANEKFKQQNSKTLTDAIVTGQIPTSLLQRIQQQGRFETMGGDRNWQEEVNRVRFQIISLTQNELRMPSLEYPLRMMRFIKWFSAILGLEST